MPALHPHKHISVSSCIPLPKAVSLAEPFLNEVVKGDRIDFLAVQIAGNDRMFPDAVALVRELGLDLFWKISKLHCHHLLAASVGMLAMCLAPRQVFLDIP
jgi:hypothetical protein